MTEEEYLEIERQADRKSEYHNAQMFAISEADLRVRIAATGLYAYPNVLVISRQTRLREAGSRHPRIQE